jgi:hypothetical protein
MFTTGARNPFCDKAPTGQIRTEGQEWFWGQRLFLMDRVRLLLSAGTAFLLFNKLNNLLLI